MMDILSMDFMQNALLAGILVSIACGLIGTLVVVNRIVFLAGGMAHTAYAGVGLAFFLKLPIILSTSFVTLLASGIMAVISHKQTERSDTVIGVMWAAGMAVGIILLDITPGYNVDLMSYLFGSILTVARSDIWIMSGLNIVILGLLAVFYNQFQLISLDREYAETRGLKTFWLYFLMLAMVAISVVMIIRVVGLILVIALLTIPPYLAEKNATSLGKMMFKAILWSLFFCIAGLWFSYQYNLTSGASIIAVATLSFFVVSIFRKLSEGLKK
jgi:zinc transport system permease protein